MADPMNELWRAQQDAATRLTESWRTLVQPAAGTTTRTPVPPEADEPAQQLGDTEPDDITDGDTDEVIEPEPELSAADALRAIQALRDGQRDLAQDMTRWAELQRDLADTADAWAGRQRDHADTLDRLLAPFSPESGERSV